MRPRARARSRAAGRLGILAGLTGLALLLAGPAGAATVTAAGPAALPWWLWLVILFAVTFGMGIFAVLAGVGGGVIFVPLVSGFFPFHFDFVRCAGLMVALANSLAAGPHLFRRNIAALNLTMPAGLVASVGAVAGAGLGLALPERAAQLALGLVILGIALIMALKRAGEEAAAAPRGDPASIVTLSRWSFFGADGEDDRRLVLREARRPGWGLACFFVVGLVAGMFGLGAGWANVPVLNLVMGVPLKVAVGTSSSLLAVTTPAAGFVYLHSGAMLPLLVVPSVFGMTLGARFGARLLVRVRPRFVRRLVIFMLLAAGLRLLLRTLLPA